MRVASGPVPGLLLGLLLAVPLAAAGCRSTTPPTEAPTSEPVPGSIRIADIAVPERARDLVLTVYPQARRVQYGERLLPLNGALLVDDRAADFDARLGESGLDLAWKELRREGYVLAVYGQAGRAVVVKAARDDAGRRWAEQAFEQLVWERDGARFVRECRVLDQPAFPLRGSKRPQAWETRYRANFAWGARDGADARDRHMVAVWQPGIPLDATGEGVTRALEYFAPWQDRGVRLFAVKFDDEGFGLTPDSELCHGRFAPALVNYLRMIRQALRQRDADARLYLLPQTYWWSDPRYEAFAAALRAAGGLDGDVGLVLTGPEVISEEIDARELAAARRAFGATETRALLYDNLGRDGDWGPLSGRDPELVRYADGVFGERGTPVHRLTRLDWLWNPEDYDPERSWRRAVLELAGPEHFEQLEAICVALRCGTARAETASLLEAFAQLPEGRWRSPLPRRELVALLRNDFSRIGGAPATAGAPASRRAGN